MKHWAIHCFRRLFLRHVITHEKQALRTVFPHENQQHTCPAALRTKCTPHTTPYHTSPRHITTRCCSHSRCTVHTHSLNLSTLATATVALPSLTVVLSCCGCRPSAWHGMAWHLKHRRRTRISLAQQVLAKRNAALPSRRTETAVRFHLCTLCQTVMAKQVYNSPP